MTVIFLSDLSIVTMVVPRKLKFGHGFFVRVHNIITRYRNENGKRLLGQWPIKIDQWKSQVFLRNLR